MIKKFIIISFFIIAEITNSYAYYDFDNKLELAFTSILAFNFEEAERLLQQEKIEKPGNDLRLLYHNYINFLKTFISEDKSDFENLKINSSLFLNELNRDKDNSTSPFHLYVQSEILIQQALVRFKFNEYIISAGEIRRAYKLIQKNKILFPSFILNQKISGLLNAIVGSVPPQYQWIIKYAGMEGDISNGLNQLQASYEKVETTPFQSYRPEILFYIGNIFLIFSMPMDTVLLFHEMDSMINKSPLISLVYSNILMKLGKNDSALHILNSSLIKVSTYPFTYLYYKRGLVRLRKLDLSAKQDFQFFLLHHKGKSNIKSAYQKLSWISLIEGDSAMYVYNLKLCAQNGVALNEDDKIAQDESKSEGFINVFLIRARLFFDGGYYANALSELAGKNIEVFPRHRDQLEVTYRLGRIMQMTKKSDKAIMYFEKTIKNGISSNYYFAANSALMVGLIHEEKKQIVLAKLYYLKCLSIKHKEYKNSIDQKALAGLERIKLMN